MGPWEVLGVWLRTEHVWGLSLTRSLPCTRTSLEPGWFVYSLCVCECVSTRVCAYGASGSALGSQDVQRYKERKPKFLEQPLWSFSFHFGPNCGSLLCLRVLGTVILSNCILCMSLPAVLFLIPYVNVKIRSMRYSNY